MRISSEIYSKCTYLLDQNTSKYVYLVTKSVNTGIYWKSQLICVFTDYTYLL